MNNVNQTLIRMTANSSDLIGKQGIFESTFNDGVLIKKDSQIAMQSCSLSRDQDSFIVNSKNNKITFQVSNAGGLHEIYLNHGSYDNNTLINLLRDIQDKMNDVLNISKAKEHNTFVDVSINDQNKVEFNFLLGKQANLLENTPANNDPAESGLHYSQNDTFEVVRGGSGTGLYLTGTASYTLTSGTRQYVFSEIPFAQGAGMIKARLDTFNANNGNGGTDGAKNGFILGLLPNTVEIMNKLKSTNSNQKIVGSDFIYAIRTDDAGIVDDSYQIKYPKSNNFELTGLVPVRHTDADQTKNDILSIQLSNGHIKLVLSTNTDGETILHESQYTRRDNLGNSIELIPYLGIFSTASHIRIGNATFSQQPTLEPNAGIDGLELVSGVGATPFPSRTTINTIYNLIFSSSTLANFLGFENLNRNEKLEKTATGRFEGDFELSKLFSTNTYLVELLSENLDSYDSLDGGRKNLLAPIPISDQVISSTGMIHYEPSNLIYINLKNNKDKLIRNLRARIVTNTYSPIKVEGVAEINVLIRS